MILAAAFATIALVPSALKSSSSAESSESSSSSTTSTYNSANCLVEVSDSTYLWRSYNSTTSGTVATFTNGTQRFFPDGQCPQPAQDGFFQIVAWLAGNPKFLAAENGSRFLFYQEGSLAGLSIGEPPEYTLSFYRWGSGTTHPCGQEFGAVRSLLGTIGVTVIGGPEEANVSNMSIRVDSNPDLQPAYLHCPPYGLPISESLSLASIKPVFTIGNASFRLLYNATGYSVSHNGTAISNPGFTMAFNVTEGLHQELFLFFWPTALPTGLPTSYPPDYSPTYPAEMSWFLNGTEPYLNVTLPYPVSGAWANSISLSGTSLCASNCGVGSSLFTGNASVHSTSSLYSLELVVNGTSQGKSMAENPLTIYSFPIREVVSQPLVKGALYEIELVAVFRDGSTSTAETFVTAA